MTKSKIFLASATFALLTLAGCTRTDEVKAPAPVANEAKQIKSVDVVKAIVPPVELAAGSTVETTIRLEIQHGYHVNANPPTFSYLIPTRLDITSSEAIFAGVGFLSSAQNREVQLLRKAAGCLRRRR